MPKIIKLSNPSNFSSSRSVTNSWSLSTISTMIFYVLLLIMSMSISISESRSVLLPSPQCHPSIVNTMPDRYRKICEALATIFDLSDTVDNYIDEKDETEWNSNTYKNRQPWLASSVTEIDRPMMVSDVSRRSPRSGVKRKEDVDHVFLRFGKRG